MAGVISLCRCLSMKTTCRLSLPYRRPTEGQLAAIPYGLHEYGDCYGTGSGQRRVTLVLSQRSGSNSCPPVRIDRPKVRARPSKIPRFQLMWNSQLSWRHPGIIRKLIFWELRPQHGQDGGRLQVDSSTGTGVTATWICDLRWNLQSAKVEGLLELGFPWALKFEGLDPGFLFAIHKHKAEISRFSKGAFFVCFLSSCNHPLGYGSSSGFVCKFTFS
jgi:hypothetical protein